MDIESLKKLAFYQGYIGNQINRMQAESPEGDKQAKAVQDTWVECDKLIDQLRRDHNKYYQILLQIQANLNLVG